MQRETYKGRKIKVVAGRGADWGYTRITLNGVDMGKWLQSEDEALRSTRGTIDHADEVGINGDRYGAEWYAPGTFELCDEGHVKEIGGECLHSWCMKQRAEVAPVVEEASTDAEHRETTITVAGVEHVIRTEVVGKIRTVKQLEAAHTKAVKAAIIEMRIAASPDTMPHEMAERLAKRATQFPACNWDAARRPLRPVTTEDPTTYLVEVEPGHYATHDAAEMLRTLEAESVDEPADVEHATVGGAEFLASLLGSVAA